MNFYDNSKFINYISSNHLDTDWKKAFVEEIEHEYCIEMDEIKPIGLISSATLYKSNLEIDFVLRVTESHQNLRFTVTHIETKDKFMTDITGAEILQFYKKNLLDTLVQMKLEGVI